jgi:hypothetical protein
VENIFHLAGYSRPLVSAEKLTIRSSYGSLTFTVGKSRSEDKTRTISGLPRKSAWPHMHSRVKEERLFMSGTTTPCTRTADNNSMYPYGGSPIPIARIGPAQHQVLTSGFVKGMW